MKMCDSCWTQLRRAIDDRGLTEFVAKSGEEAAARLASEDPRAGFDPLMGAHNALVSNLVAVAGLGMLTHDGCPLCLAVEQCGCGTGDACDFRTWPHRAADDQLDRARDLGLLPLA